MSEHVYWRHYEDGTSQLFGVRVTKTKDYDTQACRDARRQAFSPDWKLPRNDDDMEGC